ncbi:hypothetical protein SI65_09955 [Aspergillus cristatus]|uniref:Rhodopsin domain-containing protein n=1 Tax=Aspergillus cristatus TaxID=573508 RepID=A0A1E3B0Y1_ASPCR|nr:hypothetical protein SI65_09955 [Aspergillus cristatus]
MCPSACSCSHISHPRLKKSSLATNKGPAVLTTLWSLTSASLLFVLTRLLVRLRILQKAGLDDILITISIILAYIYDVILTIAVQSGYGCQQSTLSSEELSNSIMFIMAGFAPGLMSIVVPKLAVVALLIRTMNPSPRQKWFLWGTVLGSGVLLMGMTVLVDYSIVVGGIAAAVDAYLAIYPTVIIWNLHMGIKKKLGLSFALGLGACACVMAVVKCTRIPTLYNMANITYATADLFIWTRYPLPPTPLQTQSNKEQHQIKHHNNNRQRPNNSPLNRTNPRQTRPGQKPHNRKRRPHRVKPASRPPAAQQVQINQNQKRARAWLSAINIEQSYHECSIQRGSSSGSLEGVEGLTPTEEGVFGNGIQRRDDVIIEYGRWPEGIWGRERYIEKV